MRLDLHELSPIKFTSLRILFLGVFSGSSLELKYLYQLDSCLKSVQLSSSTLTLTVTRSKKRTFHSMPG